MTWLVGAALVLAGLGAGFGAGVLVGVAFAPPEPGEWEEMEEGGRDMDAWDLRVSPERYLERFPDGPHAERARRAAGR